MRLIFTQFNSLFFLIFFLGTSSYLGAQTTGCEGDYDCDGVPDILDVDRDNDGIYNHIESPNCFIIDKSLLESGDRRDLITVSTELVGLTGALSSVIDGNIASTLRIPAGTPIAGLTILQFSIPIEYGVEYSSLTFPSSGGWTGATVILKGSVDGTTWVDLSDVITLPTVFNSEVVIAVTQNQNRYRYYKISGLTGQKSSSAGYITEITTVMENFHISLYAKIDCDDDIDGDGKLNHLDTDSDGDGCFDVVEAQFKFPFIDIDGHIQGDVNPDGSLKNADYLPTKHIYYYDPNANVCHGSGLDPAVDEPGYLDCTTLDLISNDTELIVAGHHTSMSKTRDGYVIFGEYARPVAIYQPKPGSPGVTEQSRNIYRPLAITPENGFPYTGKVLEATLGIVGGGSPRFFLLTTDGLYTWGVSNGIITGLGSFTKMDLPVGVLPAQIKKISGSTTVIALLTYTGEVYLKGNESSTAFNMYGDGSSANDNQWHKASVGLVKSIKPASGAISILTYAGDLYSWGNRVYLGDGSAVFTTNKPKKLTALPTGEKVVELSTAGSNSVYFARTSTGAVYSMGANTMSSLGRGTPITVSTAATWGRVLGVGGVGFLENIKFIAAAQNSGVGESFGAIDTNGIPYYVGHNSFQILGGPTQEGRFYTPFIPRGFTPGENNAVFIAFGSHITPLLDLTTGKFGYVGHRVNGSMGDGTATSNNEAVYNFKDTPEIDFCALGKLVIERIIVNPMIRTSVYK